MRFKTKFYSAFPYLACTVDERESCLHPSFSTGGLGTTVPFWWLKSLKTDLAIDFSVFPRLLALLVSINMLILIAYRRERY